MKVDILLITYNQSQYIRHAVESILMQRVFDIAGGKTQVKLLVADDVNDIVDASYTPRSLYVAWS